MLTRTVILIAGLASLTACNRLAHQSSAHLRLQDETKSIADVANGLSAKLNLAAHKADFDYGGPTGRQTVYELTSLSKAIFVQTESADFCSDQRDPEQPTFNDRLLVVSMGAASTDELARSMVALRQVSAANGASVLTDIRQVCGRD
jgi:hypothetical protein